VQMLLTYLPFARNGKRDSAVLLAASWRFRV